MLREQIKRDIQKAISNFKFQISNVEVEVTRSSDPKFGDFSTNLALRVAKSQRANPSSTESRRGRKESEDRADKQSPMEIAKVLTDSLKNQPYVEKLEVASPGFINFFIKKEYWQKQVEDVLKLDKRYGSNQSAKDKKARVEFISANPTGPLHFGNARGGPIGDVLASVLEFGGYDVLREYYNNDLGVQVEKLGESILNVQAGKSLEDQEYKGEYVRDLTKQISKNFQFPISNFQLSAKEAGQKAVEIILGGIISDSQDIGIKFGKVYAESEFLKSGQTKKALEKIKKFIKKKDGADWFAPNDEFLKDRETVVKKSDGSYTYFANDIAYHDLKFADNPSLVIDVLGANHHGHVPRMQAAISALGFDSSCFHVILYQWVRFKRGGELVKMSKRSGTFITCAEVLKEVGKDALRFFILMHDANSHIDFDLDLAREKSSKNPVYYVQYAHARICSILAKAGVKGGSLSSTQGASLNERLSTNHELDLIKQITKLPEIVEDVSTNFAVNQLTTYATELADSFHRFYENCPVLTSEAGLKEARIGLLIAAKIALANTLNLLGISAPSKM